MTGIYNSKPSFPCYLCIWDTGVVLRYTVALGDNEQLFLKYLTIKVCMLLSLLTAQRGQTLRALSLGHMQKQAGCYRFVCETIVKTIFKNGSTSAPT